MAALTGNITTRIAEHEKSQCHQNSSEAYFITKKGESINHQLSNLGRRKDVRERRAVVGCVISVIFFIALQTLPFRSKHSESVATAFDDSTAVVNHGNFLGAVKLIAEFYPTLQSHLNKVIKLAKKRDPKKKGRGNFVTFLSKTSVVKIFKLIAEMLKERIAKDVNDAGLFSVQMDSTTDVSTHDQCAVVVRYVEEDKAKERLLRLVNVSDSRAQSLHNLLGKSLEEVGVQLDMCIGDSFDGAGNMSGVYNGLQALLKQVCPSHVHTWCYAHVLNLVIGDASTVSVQAVSLFGLLNQMANFFKESYKNMNVWEKQMEDNIGHGKLRKLGRFCQTRWSSRALALRKLFGSFNDDTKELFSYLVMVLQHVNETPNFKGSIRYEAKCLGENLSKFETVLVAFTYIRIFDITIPVSDYLQTPGLDVLQAWRMINEATDKLSNIARDFAAIYQHATTFINGVNDKLSEEGIRLTTDLPEIRVTRRAPGVQSAEKNFEINCHNVILDTVVLSISNRFSDHKELYNEIACFDPNRFKEVRTHPEMINLTTIAEALPEVDTVSLKEELLSFASNYHQLKQGLLPGNDNDLSDLSDYGDDDEDGESPSKVMVKEAACKNCFSCTFRLLSQYKLCSTAYENLFLAYKYLVTLSVTQCSCERSFSKLKLVKTRLRSSLTQENLESLMIIAIEKDLALELKNKKEKIIDKFAMSSKELSSLLLL